MLMNQFRTLLIIVLLYPVVLNAQEKPSALFVAPDAPQWVHLMMADQPNLFEVQKAYENFYQEHPFEKNSYTQHYKRWLNWARTRVQADGSLRELSVEELQQRELQIQGLRGEVQERGGQFGWSFVGPKRTYDTDADPKVTWQTNIYSIDIAPSDPNVLYAGGETGGLWRTSDMGQNWVLVTSGLLHNSFGAIKIHPTDPSIVFAATSGKILKTIDAGNSWLSVYTENNLWVNEISIHPFIPNIILAATDQGLLRSIDGGQNWSKVFTQKSWTVKFKKDLFSPNTAYAVRANGSSSQFLISNDAGATFTPATTGWWTPGMGESVTGAQIALCHNNLNKMYVHLLGSGSNLKGYVGVFVSVDGGNSWSNTNPENAIGNTPIAYSIPDHTNLATNNGVFTGFEQGFYNMAIVVNPYNDNELISGGTSWFKSTDGGQSWEALGSYVGGLPWSHPDMQALAVSGEHLWIATDGGLNYSNNFAQSMEARMDGISGADLWGFDAGWNEDVLVGGRYHNGNMAWHESFPAGSFYRMGGAEAPTGYVNPGDNRTMYFSDLGGRKLLGGFGGGTSSFGVSTFPNESYAYYANSEMAWDPRCWNHVYLGFQHKFWKSTDGGRTFNVLYTFPGTVENKVFDIEVSRSNPKVIYCSQWDGTDDAMWRSADGGLSWTALAKLPLPNNNDRVKMALSAEDENVLWVAVTYGSNNKKIYKSTNGGQTWQNLTTTTLNNIRITNIMAQYGTNGGVYLGTDAGVFYRNNDLPDWIPFSLGLPLSAETNRLKPFYRDGKIRNGTWGFGVWESNLFEPSEVIAQPIVSDLAPKCARDTIYFDDYSVVQHDGASWSWTFTPAPAYSSALNVRNPKVVFGSPGTYTATMRISKDGNNYEKALSITVSNACQADTVPGKAVVLGGNDNEGYIGLPPLNLTTNTLTVSAWIKPDGIQPEYSAIFMHDGDAAGFNFLPNLNHIGYHWDGGAWWWDSGLSAPSDEWSHVVMVVEPTGVTIYVNGKGAKHNFTVPEMNLNSGFRLGNYRGWGGRYMKGIIEEVCVFDRALTQNEVRELMHLTKVPADQPNLISYYQFNETEGTALDRVGIRHGVLSGSALRSNSTAPVGKGVSARQTVTANGSYNVGATGLTLSFPSTGDLPNGEICVSRINVAPDQYPNNHLCKRQRGQTQLHCSRDEPQQRVSFRQLPRMGRPIHERHHRRGLRV